VVVGIGEADPVIPPDGGCAQGDHYGAQTLDVAAAMYVPSLRGAQPARRRRACRLREMFPQPVTRVTIVT
jgi:hypothetical protein